MLSWGCEFKSISYVILSLWALTYFQSRDYMKRCANLFKLFVIYIYHNFFVLTDLLIVVVCVTSCGEYFIHFCLSVSFWCPLMSHYTMLITVNFRNYKMYCIHLFSQYLKKYPHWWSIAIGGKLHTDICIKYKNVSVYFCSNHKVVSIIALIKSWHQFSIYSLFIIEGHSFTVYHFSSLGKK